MTDLTSTPVMVHIVSRAAAENPSLGSSTEKPTRISPTNCHHHSVHKSNVVQPHHSKFIARLNIISAVLPEIKHDNDDDDDDGDDNHVAANKRHE